MDKFLMFVAISLLTFMIMMMWGKQERFDEKVSWVEDQLLVLTKEK